jgi:hypothetical protein
MSAKVGHFEFPARLTGDIYAEFLNPELPNLFEDIPLLFCANGWYQHDGTPPHFTFGEILDRNN